MTKVTQDDREAAAKVAVQVEMRELILAGKADHHAEPWAAHRITADLAGYERGQRETAERIVAWLWKCQETSCRALGGAPTPPRHAQTAGPRRPPSRGPAPPCPAALWVEHG